MSTDAKSLPQPEKEILRVALDKGATAAYRCMIDKLKATNSFLRFHPSDFISFIVADFFETYFDKDIDVLVAEFFDSHGFLMAETESSKGMVDFEQNVKVALAKAEKIKSKRRSKVATTKNRKASNDAQEHEKV